MKEILKEMVYQKGLDTLLTRMEILISTGVLSKLTKPTIVTAHIYDMNAVIAKIKSKWSCFDIKNISIDIKTQTVGFKISGSCWIPSKYQGFVVMVWSETQTEECDYYNTIKDEYAEATSMPLQDFINNGITVEIV